MLSPTQLAARENKLTASRVAALMTGNADKILNLWRELVGDPAFVPEDLSDVWPVRLGEATEHLNVAWYAKKHGEVSRKGEVVVGNPDWMAATLDGWDVARGCPLEAKHVGGREPLETIISRYQSQMHWQMMVTDARMRVVRHHGRERAYSRIHTDGCRLCERIDAPRHAVHAVRG